MSSENATTSDFVYHINADDQIVYFDAAWTRFAEDNAAPELTESRVIGRSLWEFIATGEMRSLYKLLMAKVRARGRAVAVSFRCDAPTCRRVMLLEIAPRDDQTLAFTSKLVEEEPRGYIALLDPDAPRTDEFLTMCSWCKSVLVEGAGWLEVEAAAEALQLFHQARIPQISHGICEACYARVLETLS